MEQLNLATLPKYLSNEAAAWELLERLRWDGKPVCPHCGTISEDHYFIAARSGERKTRTGQTTYRRLWKCREKGCRKQFSVLVGTIFESSKIPVSKWLLAIWLMSAGKNSVSAMELKRHLGIAYQSAWFMGHRLREAMTRQPLAGLLSGTVVADETYVGGLPKNKHRQGRPVYLPGGGRGRAGTPHHKTPVLALVSKNTGEVRTRVMADVNGSTLRQAIKQEVDAPNTVLHTDGLKAYKKISSDFAGHEYVRHEKYEYVRGDVSTNMAESFFAQFKRSVDGTFHNVSKAHLGRYADEFAFRWTTSKMSDAERVQKMVDQSVGKRLTYRPLTDGR
ncbi:MAG TPA: IS1595 family transposase [Acidimicrobiales bacterium]|nr:IS1595 family transposase [Acidimicrobiales bacterium]